MDDRKKQGNWSRLRTFLSLARLYFAPIGPQTIASFREIVRRKFPGVPQISTEELAARLAGNESLLIVDARTATEFAVSHLPGARNLRSVDEVKALTDSPARAIVVYCALGYRSSTFAEKLQRAGLTNVVNLEGAIFQWANEGRPLFRGSERVNVVHPYDGKWGQLLDPKRRASM